MIKTHEFKFEETTIKIEHLSSNNFSQKSRPISPRNPISQPIKRYWQGHVSPVYCFIVINCIDRIYGMIKWDDTKLRRIYTGNTWEWGLASI